jgi:hypothetical protein
MENKTKIGIGIVLLAGVGYYFYNKNKSTKTNVSTPIVEEPIVEKPKNSGFDREKASKEFAGFALPLINTENLSKQAMYKDSNGNVNIVKAQPINELSIYKSMLAMLNGIPDDSDAEFTLNQLKMIYQGGEKNYKPDLDTQIRLEKIQQKYPNAIKQMEI